MSLPEVIGRKNPASKPRRKQDLNRLLNLGAPGTVGKNSGSLTKFSHRHHTEKLGLPSSLFQPTETLASGRDRIVSDGIMVSRRKRFKKNPPGD
jgi:hypothetical protein